jgi:6-phosphogluconolactonase
MKKQVRAFLVCVAGLATLGLANCGKYNCATDDGMSFSGSTCTSTSPSGISSGGGTTSSSGAAFVFAVDTGASAGSSNGTIDGYELNTSTSTFAAISGYTAPTIPPSDGGIGMVVAQKQFLYAGFADAKQIYGWTIDSTSGALTAISGSPYSASFLNSFGGQVAQAQMITNPAGTLLFISLPLANEIYAYEIGSSGALTPVAGAPFSVPFGPVNMATDGAGKFLYVVEGDYTSHTGSEIAAYSIGSTGALTAVSGSPFAFPMWQVQGEPTGKFLIGTSGNSNVSGFSGTDDDNLYVFSISSSGAITPVAGSPFATVYSPFSIAVSPNSGGDLVYSFSISESSGQTSFNALEGYTISSSGALTAVSGSPFTNLGNGSSGSWGQFDQSGAFLFVYGEFITNPSTDTFVIQVSPFNVPTGGVLTSAGSTADLATAGFWAATDSQ